MTSSANQDVSILQGGQVRVFIQKDGISPASGYLYYGCLSLDGPTQDLGTPDPVYCPSSNQRNAWDIVDSVPKVPALGTTDFTQRMDRFLKDVWWELKRKGCNFNLQAVVSKCDRPDDFTKWDAKLLLRDARLTNLKMGALNPLSGDDNAPIDIQGSLIFREMTPINSIQFEEVAGATVVAEVLDGIFYDVVSCGDCGSVSDGCQKLYWLTRANPGSPGLSSQIVYSLDGGATWATIDINALGGVSGNRIAAVGGMLVVVSEAKGGHVYSPFASIDAGTIDWTLVTTGYVAAKSPRAIYSKSTNETYIAAVGGYIYFMSDPTLAVTVLTDGSVTTQNLNDIHGFGRTVVAVGASNAVLKSDNAGETFSLITGPAVGANLTAIWCMSKNVWFIGTGGGALYYTVNGGSTWTQISFGGATVINDIKFENDTIGYMAAEVAGVARVYRTSDSGHSWAYSAPAISGLPTALRINAVAPCGVNEVAVGGLKTTDDGIIAIAQ
jgi:photosystem II stability/assembly factor-like uncharacterized protein